MKYRWWWWCTCRFFWISFNNHGYLNLHLPYVKPEDFEFGDMKNAFCIDSAGCKVDHLARLAEKLIGTLIDAMQLHH